MIPLDPVLQFAGLIAGVLADLEHGDDDDFDRDGLRRCEQRYRATEMRGQNTRDRKRAAKG